MTAVGPVPLAAQPKSDWELAEEERNWREVEVALPPYPNANELVEFNAGAATDFRFYIDRSSISVGKDGVVRYALVARSATGAENVSYEGIRCRSGTARAYAFGRSGGSWSQRGTAWHPVRAKGAQRWHYVLWREYFCPHTIAIVDAAEGIEALRRGGHPNAARAGALER